MTLRRGSFIALLSGLCGCSMCQSPWDYSGPVAGSPPIPYGATTAREGSVLNGGPVASTPTISPSIPPAPPAMKKPATTEQEGRTAVRPGVQQQQR